MLNFIKEQFNRLLLCLVYTVIASLIYGVWTWKLWQLWYVTLIIVLVIVAIGVVISYLWIKSDLKKQKQEQNTIENNNQ